MTAEEAKKNLEERIEICKKMIEYLEMYVKELQMRIITIDAIENT